MITELLGLAGSGIVGAVFGMISDAIHSRREQKLEETKLRIAQEARLNGQVHDHLHSETGFTTSNTYGFAFLCITATYCICALMCFIWPDVTLQTFNPEDEPRKFELLWGVISWSIKNTKVYTITTGGVGYALLHPLAFQIGTVITGISPMHKKG